MDDLYREVILDHYKNPRGHGVIEDADAQAEGLNPLCGDEVSIYVQFAEDGETIDEVKFSGRGCAISQASTSMLMEMVKGRTATEIAELPKDELLEEIGIPLTPVRLKCALLGLGVLKVALHRAKGTPLPEEWAGLDELDLQVAPWPTSTSPGRRAAAGTVKIVHAGEISVGVYNLGGQLYAIEDRCSHDDGPLCEGDFDARRGRRRLPAARRAHRHPHRPAALAAGRPAGRDLPGAGRGRHGQGRRSLMAAARAGRARTRRTTATTTRSGGGRWWTSAGCYERLCLEGFQSGLSWLTILRKREAFRAAFAGFDPERVAEFGERRRRAAARRRGIVRHRGQDRGRDRERRARRSALRERTTPLPELVWAVPRRRGRRLPRTPTGSHRPTVSEALSKELRRAGFRFVGPTTVYAAMQACGVVNDHLATCPARAAAEEARVRGPPESLACSHRGKEVVR